MTKLTFGKRRVEYGDIEYDIIVYGRKIGELKRYCDGDVYVTDGSLEEAGLWCAEHTAREAKAFIVEQWETMRGLESRRVLKLADQWGDVR